MPRKVVKKKGGSKILGSLSPLYGMISGEGAFGNLAKSGFSPAAALARKMKKNKQTPVATTARANTGGSLKAVPEGNKGLKKLPTEVRNKMGFMKDGGFTVERGTARGGGAATKGLGYNVRPN